MRALYTLINSAAQETDLAGAEIAKNAKEMNKADFIQSCETYNYKDLKRTPEDLAGSHIQVKLWVEQDVDGGTTYRAYSKGPYDDDSSMWTGNEYVLIDARENPATRI